MMERYISALTIAGSDSSGGAGIQADLKTFSALGVYGATAVTAVTVQNTMGVKYVQALPPQVVYDQIVTVLEDINIDAVKIGMVNDAATLTAIVDALKRHRPKFLAVDPVMVSTSGCPLIQPDALDIIKERLLPLADIVTPNIHEAFVLAGRKTSNGDDNIYSEIDETALTIMCSGVKALLIKGGHIDGKTKKDCLYIKEDNTIRRICLSSETVETANTHGTGCTLSSAITAFAARGMKLEQAVRNAKKYITEALKAGADIHTGNGHGPVNHFYRPEAYITADKDIRVSYGSAGIKRKAFSGTAFSPAPVSLQFITHFTEKYSYTDSAMMALEGGCRWIQLRMKDACESEIERTALRLIPECRRRGAIFIIDDHVELAIKTGADGVHLGKNDMSVADARRMAGPDFIIGGTANTFEDIQRIAREGADYIGCGPFRFTTTKKNLAPVLGADGYENIISQMRKTGISLPLVAIGGITIGDIPDLMQTGVSGIALSGSILRSDHPVEDMKNVIRRLNNKTTGECL